MRKTLNRKLIEVWPHGPNDLFSDLEALGFRLGPLDANQKQSLAQRWSLLEQPRSSEIVPQGHSDFSYLAATGKIVEASSWGLIFCDPKRAAELQKLGAIYIPVEAPDAAMDFVLRKIFIEEWSGKSAPIPPRVRAEDGVVIGPGTEIGEGTILESHVRIGARVVIGANCRIGSGSRIADDTVLGEGCQLAASVCLGSQGFGFVKYPKDANRRPRLHVGRVRIGDHVRLGAFVAVDRGVLEDTVIGSDSALDNIVQVAHNCEIGEAATLCSFVGLSGSTLLGKRVTMAGMVGTKGHIRVGDDVTVAAQSGISRDIANKEVVKGYPPKPLSKALKIQALVDKLPELYERIKKLEKEP